MAHATEFIHSQNYAHLDIKLENILLDKYFNVKVADLGAAVYLGKSGGKTHYRRGTILYMAPEVLNLKSGETFDAYAADIYSLGIWLHVMMVGEFPNPEDQASMTLTADSESQTIDESDDCSMEGVVKKRWDLISDNAKALILKMISKDPTERPNINWNLFNIIFRYLLILMKYSNEAGCKNHLVIIYLIISIQKWELGKNILSRIDKNLKTLIIRSYFFAIMTRIFSNFS